MSNVHILYFCKHCNLQCKYCYEKGKEYVKMPFEAAKKAIDTIVDENPRDKSNINVILFGGEPLLNWDVLYKTIEYAHKTYFTKGVNLKLILISNGTLMNKERVRDLFPFSKMLTIQISIDGNKETHDTNRVFKSGIGSHDIVINNCKTLLQYFPFATVKMVISDVDKFFDNVEYLRKIGFRDFDFLAIVGSKTKLPEYYIEKFKATVEQIKDHFKKFTHTKVGQVIYPYEDCHEHREQRSKEADASGQLYKYFLPEGKRITQKSYVNHEFEHFTKGDKASVNLLNKKPV